MTDLFDRDLLLNAGGLEIRSRAEDGAQKPTLRVVFRIERSLARDPNTAQITFYNLNEDRRTFLQTRRDINTVLEAGYVGNRPQIFSGTLEYGSNTRQGVDWVSTIQSRDGSKATSSKRINKAFKKIKIGQVLQELSGTLGIGIGNAQAKANEGAQRGNVVNFENGIVLSGNVYDKIEQIAQQMGLIVSIQDNSLLFLDPNEALDQFAVVLRPPQNGEEGTGLIGSPEPGEKGIVNVRSLIQPGLVPGGRIELDSASVAGQYRIERCIYMGDTWGTDWYVDLEAKPI